MEVTLSVWTNQRLVLPVSERRYHQAVGVAQVLEPVVEAGVDHLELHRLVHPVISDMRHSFET